MSDDRRELPPSLATRGKVGMGVRQQVAIARKLRSASTDVERKLWQKIRERQIEEFRFRRQRPIGNFVVDFVCLEAKLIVELDGGQHAEPAKVAADETRTKFLESLGYRMLRFWNNEVLENMQGVLEHIREMLLQPAESNPTPALPLAGEGASLRSTDHCERLPSLAQRGKVGMGVHSNGVAAKISEKDQNS